MSSPMGSVSQLQRHRQFGPVPSSPESISTVSSRRSSRAPPPPGYKSHSCVQLGCELHSSVGSLGSVTPPAGFRSTNTLCRSDVAIHYPDLIRSTASTASVPYSTYFRQLQPRYNLSLGPDFDASASGHCGYWRNAAARSNPDSSWRHYAADLMTGNQQGLYDDATVSELRRRRARQALSQQLVAADKAPGGAEVPLPAGVAAVGKIPLPPMPAAWRQQVQLWEKQGKLQQQKQDDCGPYGPPDGLLDRAKIHVQPISPISPSSEHPQQNTQKKVTRRRTPAPWAAEKLQLRVPSQRQNSENHLSQDESRKGIGNLARTQSPPEPTAGKARAMAPQKEGVDPRKQEPKLTEPRLLFGDPVNNLMTNSQLSKSHIDNAPDAGVAGGLLHDVTLLPADPSPAAHAGENREDEDDVQDVPGTVTPPGRSHRPMVLRCSARSSSSAGGFPAPVETATTSIAPECNRAATSPEYSQPAANSEPENGGAGGDNGVPDDIPNSNIIVRSTAEAEPGELSTGTPVIPELSALSPSVPAGSMHRGLETWPEGRDLRATAMLEAQLQFFPLKFVLAEVKPQTPTGRSDVYWAAPAPVTVTVTVPMHSAAVGIATTGQGCTAEAAAAVNSVNTVGAAAEASDRGNDGEGAERQDDPGRCQVVSDAAESMEKPQQKNALPLKPEGTAKDNAATENGAQMEVLAPPPAPPPAAAAAAAARHVEKPEGMPVIASWMTERSGVIVSNAASSHDSHAVTKKGEPYHGPDGFGERKDSAQEISAEAAKNSRVAKTKKARRVPRDGGGGGGEIMAPPISTKAAEVTAGAGSTGKAAALAAGSFSSPKRPHADASASSNLKMAGNAEPEPASSSTSTRTRAISTALSGTSSTGVRKTPTNQECSKEESQRSWQSRKSNGSRPRSSPDRQHTAANKGKAKARASRKAVCGSTVQSSNGVAAAAAAAMPVSHPHWGQIWGKVWAFLFQYHENTLDDDGSVQDGEDDETGEQGSWRAFTFGLLLSAALVCGSALLLSRMSEAQLQPQEVHQRQRALPPMEQGPSAMALLSAAPPLTDRWTRDASVENSSNLEVGSMLQPSPSSSGLGCGLTDDEIASGLDGIGGSNAPADERDAASDDAAATGAKDAVGLEGEVARDETGAEQQSLTTPTVMGPSEVIASHPQYAGSDIPAWIGKDPQTITAELEDLLTGDVRTLGPEEDAMLLELEALARQSDNVAMLEGWQTESSGPSGVLQQEESVQVPQAVAGKPAVAQASADESKSVADDHQRNDGIKTTTTASEETVALDAKATMVDQDGKSLSVPTHPRCVGLSISAAVVLVTSTLLWAAGRHRITCMRSAVWNSMWKVGSIASAWKTGKPTGKTDNGNGAIGQVQGLPGGDGGAHRDGQQEEEQQQQQRQDRRHNPTMQHHFWDVAPNAALLDCFFLRSNRLVPRGSSRSQDGAGGAGALPGASDGGAGGVGANSTSGRGGLNVGYHWLRNRTVVCFNKREMSPEALRLMSDVHN
ncbi:hypothetical protein Vretimale_2112 [Volvox reticuliferus]|nr:hypothetical protein Vretimale_2112 [Volvox reticuliferus]